MNAFKLWKFSFKIEVPFAKLLELFVYFMVNIIDLLCRHVKKQNCSIWCENNPRKNLETPLHPLKLTVLSGVYANGIIGPYFFRNEEGVVVTVNGV